MGAGREIRQCLIAQGCGLAPSKRSLDIRVGRARPMWGLSEIDKERVVARVVGQWK